MMVTLSDGSQARSDSEAWRAECEARWVCRMPSLSDRQAYLAGVEAKRGKPAADALRADVRRLWSLR